MRRNLWIVFGVIILVLALAILIDLPKSPLGGDKIKAMLGLDLQGGTELTYQADLSQSKNKIGDMDNLKSVFGHRIDQLGVAEPTIQTVGTDRILIELPGIKDINQAISKIGQTYELVFMTQAPDESTGLSLNDYYEDFTYPGTWIASDLTGRNLKSAEATFDTSKNQIKSEPLVSISFDNAGKEKFAELTKNNLNKRIAIVLDNKIVSAPNVQTEITDGRAVITGSTDIKAAQDLAKRLNEGMLPVPATLVAQQNVGATLGQESIKYSLVAGVIGLLALAVFMITYYSLAGLLSVIALIIYAAISLALFKLIPVTMSLAGIAGFILSVGMAVDANVLIFERMKEEIRSNKEATLALKDGFLRAWPSIRDSNLSSLITCVILYAFGTGSVRGFALTLSIGILVSLFTAITVTRTLMLLTAGLFKIRWFNV